MTDAKPKTAKPKAPPAHPKYAVMIVEAVAALKERTGSSRQAITKYIKENYNEVKENKIRLALQRMSAKKDEIEHTKGAGASGSFKLVKKEKPAKKKAAAKPKVKKPVAKKPKSPKKVKKAAKSPKKDKKPVAKKAAKKPAAKKPAAKKPAAKKPAAKKPAAKKPAAKKPAAKKAAKKPAKKAAAKK